MQTQGIREQADHVFEQFQQNAPAASNVGEFYDSLNPEGYLRWKEEIDCKHPQKVVETIADPAMVQVSHDCAILDVGAGTGVVGNLLKQKGFTNIVGADASAEFVKVAQASGAYKETRALYFGMGLDKYPEDLKNRFDIVTASCVWCPGHIPNLGFDDIHASLKTGGYFVTPICECYWENGEKEGYKDKMDEMIRQGKFKQLSQVAF